MQHSSNPTSDQIEWAQKEYSKSKVRFEDLKSGPYGPLFQSLSEKLSTTTPRQLLWHVVNSVTEPVLCACGSPRSWVRNLNSYRHTCGPKCAGQLVSSKSPRKEKIKKDPWYKDPARTAKIVEKRRKTTLEKYGVDHHRKRPEIAEKIRKTNIDRYGSPTPFSNDEIQRKARASFAERYSNNDENLRNLVDKRKSTSMARYGVEHPMMSSDVREKQQDTMVARHGVRHALQHQDINNKRNTTNLQRYGVKEASQFLDVKARIIKTNLERYGVDNWTKSKFSGHARSVLANADAFSSELFGMTLDEAKDHLGVSLRTY